MLRNQAKKKIPLKVEIASLEWRAKNGDLNILYFPHYKANEDNAK